MKELVIVTAASSNHFRCLCNLLYSIRCWEPNARTVVYDLGLRPSEASMINGAVSPKRFDYSIYPSYVNIRVNRGEYAWKPIIIAEVLAGCTGTLLWLDAGNLLLAPLDRVCGDIEKNGIVTPTSAGTIREWTHPGTLYCLQAPLGDLNKRNRTGAIVGLSGSCEFAKDFAGRWRDCALIRECIAPEGSSRANHRQDQAALSVLYYQFQERHGFASVNSVPEITRHNDGMRASEVKALLDQLSRDPRSASAGSL